MLSATAGRGTAWVLVSVTASILFSVFLSFPERLPGANRGGGSLIGKRHDVVCRKLDGLTASGRGYCPSCYRQTPKTEARLGRVDWVAIARQHICRVRDKQRE